MDACPEHETPPYRSDDSDDKAAGNDSDEPQSTTSAKAALYFSAAFPSSRHIPAAPIFIFGRDIGTDLLPIPPLQPTEALLLLAPTFGAPARLYT
ncbi:hypothetical protein F503_07697 [Ophiostoma piceae UAMH 11346]|uniref:Uncharacterized protein n=1 Tax=Ophiostoma piceae (strain UAMH 11346) TaxID=1262450 RepID=S3BPY3_OPHP1|nr:hypothetical protein F503_07697 [Ophiostoma piceae UAMH 11346]